MKESRARVAAKLKRGRYDDVVATSWSRLDSLMAFMQGIGLFGLLDNMKDEITRTAAIPRFIIYNLLLIKSLLGEESLLHLSKGLFLDRGVLRSIGVTAREIRKGFDTSRNKKDNKPFHIDSIRYCVSKVAKEEVIQAFSQSVALLKKHGFLRKAKTYIIDGTDIAIDGDYEGAGRSTKVKRVLLETGEVKKEFTTKKGFKLVTLAVLTEVGPLVVDAVYQKIQTSERLAADKLIADWNFSEGDLLLMDRGFIDGERLYRWHKRGIDFVIPLKKNMDIRADMVSLSKLGTGVKATRGGTKKKPDLAVEGFSSLASLESYPGKLCGILVTTYKGEEIAPDKQRGFISTLPAATADQVLAIYDAYDLRSLIENQGYRELKQGFELARFFGKDSRSQHFHVFFTLIMYNMVAAYKSKRADKFLGKGVRRLRDELGGPGIIVYAGDYFAVFDVREFATILGRPPTGDLDEKRFRFM
jgi:hypothetical protein